MSETKLEPCPFCGGDAVLNYKGIPVCRAMCREFGGIEAWNRRASPSFEAVRDAAECAVLAAAKECLRAEGGHVPDEPWFSDLIREVRALIALEAEEASRG